MKNRFQWLLLSLVVMPIVAVAVFGITQGFAGKERARRIPDFRLTDASGREISREDLLGKVWVADFIFTECPGICPMLTARMKQLEKEFGHDPHFRLVSITVDPETDSKEVLAQYAKQHDANLNTWHFLTGDRGVIKALLQEGFQVMMDGMEDQSSGMITHSNHFVVVDRNGVIRNRVEVDDAASLSSVKRSVYKYLGKRF